MSLKKIFHIKFWCLLWILNAALSVNASINFPRFNFSPHNNHEGHETSGLVLNPENIQIYIHNSKNMTVGHRSWKALKFVQVFYDKNLVITFVNKYRSGDDQRPTHEDMSCIKDPGGAFQIILAAAKAQGKWISIQKLKDKYHTAASVQKNFRLIDPPVDHYWALKAE